jgi:redox-sensitive bicupin YhaK (pirin superfamily)
MANISKIEHSQSQTERLGNICVGSTHKIGDNFTARHFSEEMFGGRMDPLLMVDDFVMTGPTFDPHLHAGISAVTMIFEDSIGEFLSRDTLGHNVALRAGDLYWLAAASGAAHEERPADGARIHALQIFVNLPARLKKEPARALHVEANDAPVIEGDGYRVRVILGRSGDTVGADGTPEEMTMLDGTLGRGSRFSHKLMEGRQAWIYAVSGDLTVRAALEQRVLAAGGATTVAAGDETEILLEGSAGAHFVLMAARPIREPFIKHGPLVMSSVADVQRTLAGYARGQFGHIPT